MSSVVLHSMSGREKEGIKDRTGNTCCPWSHGLRPKKLSVSVAVPPAPVQVSSQRPLALSITNDPGIYAWRSIMTLQDLRKRKFYNKFLQ